MKIAKFLAACFLAALSIASCQKPEETISTTISLNDSLFIQQASINNYAQIQAAQLALSRSADTVVVSFAQHLLTQHTQARTDLINMGTIVNFVVKDTSDAAHAAVIAQLNGLSNRSFDSTYVHTQQTDHQAAVSFYTDEVINGSQLNVKRYAGYYLQYLQIDKLRADSIAAAFY